MMLVNKLEKLQEKVPGYRKVRGYRETFRPSFEECNDITPLPSATVRILTETEFAIGLSQTLGGKYDGLIDETLDFLLLSVEKDGTLTNSVCVEAEKILMPLSDEAKEYELILCGHAHIDMNWMWGYNETVAATVATFSTMLDIMDEYPDFCFSQSQTAVYEIVDKYAPELKERMMKRIKEGRWEITSSAWVETDKNMPSTESLLRHIKSSKDYLRDNWDIDPDSLEIDFSPDTFGHSANVPEIDRHGGVKYMYHCRALVEPYSLYRYKGQSGKEVLSYFERYWYNAGIHPEMALGIFDISEKCLGFKTGLLVYGVGDHGGGPTRRDLNLALEMQKWPIYPKLKFGTLKEFFKKAETMWDKLPVVDSELNCLFTGCYTTQGRIKYGNRMSEKALINAENMGALAKLHTGRNQNRKGMEKAWQNVLFTHFHDILTGTCVPDARDHSMGLYQEAISYANSEFSLSLKALSENVDTSMFVTEHDPMSRSENAGVGFPTDSLAGIGNIGGGNGLTRIFTVFNPTCVHKKEPVLITVWDWNGDLRRAELKDSKGNELEIQLVHQRQQDYWEHRYFSFYAVLDIPPYSCETIALSQKEQEKFNYIQNGYLDMEIKDFVLENDFIKAEISYSDGELISLFDKENGTEIIKKGETAGLRLIDTRSSNAWVVGTYYKRHRLDDITDFDRWMRGSLRKEIGFTAKYGNSKFTVKYSLDKYSKYLRCELEADWDERVGETCPVLIYSVPLENKAEKYMYNIPAGSIVRKNENKENPGLSYAQALSGGVNAGIMTDSKYGFRGLENELICTLINGSTDPDVYSERCVHKMSLGIGVFDGNPLNAEKEAISFATPLIAQATGSHTGSLKPCGSFMEFDSDTAVVTSMDCDDDAFTVRVSSVCNENGSVSLGFASDVKEAYFCTLMGEKEEGGINISGNKISFSIPAKTIKTLKVKI